MPPPPVVPMLAQLSELPVADRQEYAFEFKWEGVRCVAEIGPKGVVLWSRSGRDMTAAYPELQDIASALKGRRAILDGEIIALDDSGRPDFGTIQERIHLTKPHDIARKMEDVPVTYMVFDILRLDEKDLTWRPYVERRKILEALKLEGHHWHTPNYVVGDGDLVLEASKALRLEGVVAKRLTSPYQAGRRTPDWLKIKNKTQQEFVVGGWTAGEGGRNGTIGSLLLGYYEGDRLRYAGSVGTGFTMKTLAELDRLLPPLERSTNPFADVLPARRKARFARPKLVAEVEFLEWTKDGILRHPSLKGLRWDKAPESVVRETPAEVNVDG